jgi:maltooligosyltrehalose trehalohydrolase
MFAPSRLYGQPDDFRRFVDQAHRTGLGVILDVVYNHFGNVDNYLGQFADNFKSTRHKTEWADAINFDDANSRPVREFFEANARYWIEEFHLDGYRYDATHAIYDTSPKHILAAVNRAARQAAGQRSVYLVAENEAEQSRMARPANQGGYDMDAIWNDDFHHAAQVLVTGSNPGYYSDFQGTPEELATAIKHGFIYQGQWSAWMKKNRGTSTTGLPATAFVSFLQNHDQISNSRTGQRLHELTSPGRFRAITALWLLAPQTPLFFQGQEFSASSPFVFFADYTGEMAAAVRRGRNEYLSQFPVSSAPNPRRETPNPCATVTQRLCRLDLAERVRHRPTYDLHIDLLKLRREDPVFRLQSVERLETAALSPKCLAVRFEGEAGAARLVIANFGSDLPLAVLPPPFCTPQEGSIWQTMWHSNAQRYGGPGPEPLETKSGWLLPAEATVVLQAVPASKTVYAH